MNVLDWISTAWLELGWQAVLVLILIYLLTTGEITFKYPRRR